MAVDALYLQQWFAPIPTLRVATRLEAVEELPITMTRAYLTQGRYHRLSG